MLYSFLFTSRHVSKKSKKKSKDEKLVRQVDQERLMKKKPKENTVRNRNIEAARKEAGPCGYQLRRFHLN
jgi:hypothetical protein